MKVHTIAKHFNPILLLLAFAANDLVIGCSAEEITNLNQVTVFDSQILIAENIRTDSHSFRQDFLPIWNPPTNIVSEVFRKLPEYLLAKKLANRLKQLPMSVCQVIGITFEGHQLIFLNFLPANNSRLRDYWRRE